MKPALAPLVPPKKKCRIKKADRVNFIIELISKELEITVSRIAAQYGGGRTIWERAFREAVTRGDVSARVGRLNKIIYFLNKKNNNY